jgi:hypothetical protein
VASHLESHQRAVWVAEVDPHAIGDVGNGHALAIDEHSVQAAVVDRHPSALVEAQVHMRARDQVVGNAHVGAQVSTNYHVVACRKGAWDPVVQHGEGWRCCLRHRG